jgi:hypothetical protein
LTPAPEASLEQALSLSLDELGEEHALTGAVLRELIRLYESWNKQGEADRHRQQMIDIERRRGRHDDG